MVNLKHISIQKFFCLELGLLYSLSNEPTYTAGQCQQKEILEEACNPLK